jgi:hypothetical protein
MGADGQRRMSCFKKFGVLAICLVPIVATTSPANAEEESSRWKVECRLDKITDETDCVLYTVEPYGTKEKLTLLIGRLHLPDLRISQWFSTHTFIRVRVDKNPAFSFEAPFARDLIIYDSKKIEKELRTKRGTMIYPRRQRKNPNNDLLTELQPNAL